MWLGWGASFMYICKALGSVPWVLKGEMAKEGREGSREGGRRGNFPYLWSS